MAEYASPVKLAASHVVDGFQCGVPALDDWLIRFALVNQSAGMATVFVTTVGDAVVGYYALASGSILHDDVPTRISRGVARHPIPIVILTRLAVHEDHSGRGLGRALLRDALLRLEVAAAEIGIRALLIHAKDEEAKAFYLRLAEFEPSPTDGMHLLLLMKDVRRALDT